MTVFLCHGGGGVNADAITAVLSSPPVLEPTFLAAPSLRSATNWTTAQLSQATVRVLKEIELPDNVIGMVQRVSHQWIIHTGRLQRAL